MSLFLIRIPCNMRQLNIWGGQRRLIVENTFDKGYALHKLLTESFGIRAMQPFRLFSHHQKSSGFVYAYSNTDASDLCDLAHSFALPEVFKIIDINELSSKKMPSHLKENQLIGFDVRVRPVCRSSLIIDPQTGMAVDKKSSKSEIDFYIWSRFHSNLDGPRSELKATVTRESAYTDWMAERLGLAARLEACSLSSFKRCKVFRGKDNLTEGPDAVLRGTLKIQDKSLFQNFIKIGIGRHRAFGYGMLLLRPPTYCH